MNTIVSPEDLASRIKLPDTVIIDARTGPAAKEKFLRSHLSAARFVDLESDLSTKSPNPANGGRHPLPTPQRFSQTLGALGIQPSSKVYVYDDKSGANAAARFWWMLQSVGHENVWVIDGGYQAAVSAGITTSSGTEDYSTTEPYPATSWKLPTVALDEVRAISAKGDRLIVDVREAFRYAGEREPIDTVAGHIPGAINVPYLENLNDQGRFLPKEVLLKKYKEALDVSHGQNVVVHCGSGVTACHTLLALAHAGFTGSHLYVGSWSEWSRNDLPIITK